MLHLQKGMKVLLPGAGTGLDLKYLPTDVEILATDLTPAMVTKINKRITALGSHAKAEVMNAQQMALPDASYDVVVLHLIMAVIPDPIACIKEVERVLKPGGEVVIFDKFVSQDQHISLSRKILNPVTNLLFSEINRSLETIIAHTSLQMVHAEQADCNGTFKISRLIKPFQT